MRMHLVWGKKLFCKVDFWSTVDLGQRLTSVNCWPWSML